MTLTINFKDIEFELEGSYTPYRPATMYNRFGDPGDPAEGGNFDLEVVKIGEADVAEVLSKDTLDALTNSAEEQCAEQY